MPKKAKDPLEAAYRQLETALGDWKTGERRRYCAYCGKQMKLRCAKGQPTPPNKSTWDHVIPKKHNGHGVTIPACFSCNQAKGAVSLQEFLLSDYFSGLSKNKRQWRARDLWMVASLAALKQARAS